MGVVLQYKSNNYLSDIFSISSTRLANFPIGEILRKTANHNKSKFYEKITS
jgi:hypothetical protein